MLRHPLTVALANSSRAGRIALTSISSRCSIRCSSEGLRAGQTAAWHEEREHLRAELAVVSATISSSLTGGYDLGSLPVRGRVSASGLESCRSHGKIDLPDVGVTLEDRYLPATPLR